MEYETIDNEILDTSNLSSEEGELFVKLLELDKRLMDKGEFQREIEGKVISVADKYKGKADSYKDTVIFMIYSDILRRKV